MHWPKSPVNHDAMKQPLLYSIGHSDHSIEAFLELLRRYQITVVVDVRSQPYSQWNPQFNRESLARALEAASVHYIFMGDSLGGRPTDRSFYDPGQDHPNYDRLASNPAYQKGIQELLNWATADTVAIMCSEGDYRHCHRAKLITPSLVERGARVLHIRPNGAADETAYQLSLF